MSIMDLDFKVWEAISYAWTEIGLGDDEYPDIAKSIRDIEPNWEKVNSIILRDVCSSFAVDSILVIPFWMMMPDWSYDEGYITQRIRRWKSRPYWLHFINPIRILGYPISLFFSYGVRKKLKYAFDNT